MAETCQSSRANACAAIAGTVGTPVPPGRGVGLGSRDGALRAAAEGDGAREVPAVRRAGAAGERLAIASTWAFPGLAPAVQQQRERDDDAGGAERRRDREAHLWRVQVEPAAPAAGP
jgi:hypothetical protein